MTDKITTTLAQIRKHSPCQDGYAKLCKSLGGIRKYGKDTPVTFSQIYDSNGYDDTLWCIRSIDEKWHPLARHFACDCAEDVKHLIKDKRSNEAIRVSRLFADGQATEDELAAARAAAGDAARAAAGDAAWDAAWAAAGDAAWAAAGDAAWAASRFAARDAQMERWFSYCRNGERVFKKEGAE